MKIEDKIKLQRIYSKYAELHIQLNSLETEVRSLLSRQNLLSQELNQLRSEEKELINNIEEELARPLLQEEIMQIINHE